MSGRHRRGRLAPAWRSSRGRGRLVVAALLALGAAVLTVPAARGAYIARVTHASDSATTAAYFTCAAAQTAAGAANTVFTYPFGDSGGGTTVADISGNARTGTYSSVLGTGLLSGVTQGVANSGAGAVCPRDGRTVVRLNGTSGAITGPATSQPGLTTFTIEIWFRTTVAGGKLIGFGSSPTGLSASYDRHLYLDTSGHVVFGVYPNAYKTVTSTGTYLDGAWHYAAATLSGAGMVLYVDGVQVGTPDPSTTTAQGFTGYWRIGYDNLSTWAGAGNPYFTGDLAFASVENVALTSTQIAQHYTAGR